MADHRSTALDAAMHVWAQLMKENITEKIIFGPKDIPGRQVQIEMLHELLGLIYQDSEHKIEIAIRFL